MALHINAQAQPECLQQVRDVEETTMQPAKHPTIASLVTPTVRAALLGTTALAFVAVGGVGGAPASADELDDLRAEIEEMQRKLEELEKRQQEAPPPDNIVTGGDIPGSFKLPGTDTSIKIGGYVKSDFIYDVDGFAGPSVYFSSLPFRDTPLADRQAGFTFHARQSRLNVKTHTPTEVGDIDTHLEFDFLRNTGNEVLSNSFTPRLRHAYGTIGPLLIGQTWTTFMDVDAYPWTVDFFGPAGFSFIRQPMIRWTQDLGGGNSLAFALEQPELVASSDTAGALAVGTGAVGGSDGVLDQIPDFVLRFRAERDWGWVQLAGVARDLAIDLEPGELTPPTLFTAGSAGGKDDEFGWGVHLSTVFDVPGTPVTIGAVGIVGEGVGRYIIAQGFNLGGAEIRETGAAAEVEALEQYGAAGWVQYNWTDDVWSVVAYGREDTEVPEALPFAARDGTNDWVNSLHVNTHWNVTDQVTMGLEYIRGWAETATNREREANRIQFGTYFWF